MDTKLTREALAPLRMPHTAEEIERVRALLRGTAT